jgi:ribosomal protein S18 acetylase RimI-like enzyme
MTTIRCATVRDTPAIVDLWSRAAGPTRLPCRASEVEQLLERDPDALLVAEQDGRLAGTLIVGWDGWRASLYRLAVEPALRRAGVARALLAAARVRADRLGAKRLDAIVSRENAVGVAFWESDGFELEDDNGRWSALL